MGIQGLSGYLDNNEFTVNYDSSKNQNFKFLYLDFQSIIYTVFNYQENLINMMLSNLHNYDETHTKIDNNKIIFAILNKVRLLIKDSEFGRKLFTFNKKKITMKGNVDVLINLLETQFEYKNDSELNKYFSNELINDVEFGIKNYMDNKMDYVSDCIIELISNLITKFDNLEECNIIFDGKPFVAKMVEQIKRRAPDSIVTDILSDLERSYTKNGLIDLPKNLFFDRALISRDSDFVQNLIKKFKALNLKVKDKPAQELKIEVISKEDGEGEHIINKRILEKAMSIEDGNFLYYSPDGDVVFLTMILNIILRMNSKKNFVHLIRYDLIDYTSYKFNDTVTIDGITKKIYEFKDNDMKIKAINESLNQTKINLLYNNIHNLENDLLIDITKSYAGINEKGKNIMLSQYIILFSIFGNDFLPKLLSVSIGQMNEIIKDFNNYLKNESVKAGKNLENFLTKSEGKNEDFKFLANFDGSNITIKQDVLFDFFKSLCFNKKYPETTCDNHEKFNIRKRLIAESTKGSKDLDEYINGFKLKKMLLNYTDKNCVFEFIKYLLYGNYYISLENINLNPRDLKLYNDNYRRIKLLINKNNKTPAEIIELNEKQDKYFKEVIFNKASEYLKYSMYIGADANPNPYPLRKHFFIPERGDFKMPNNRISPLNEIIDLNINMKAEGINAIKQYIQGFQYIADLYFTCNIKNKCWYYQFENPPRITEIVKYMSDNSAVNLLDYSGFYGETHETLYNNISHGLTRKINIQYIKSLVSAKYYLIPEIFHCENNRYLNKCQLRGDTNIVFIGEVEKETVDGNKKKDIEIINIMYEDYDQSKPKPQKILKLAKESLLSGGSNNYYKKYLKYKMKYLKLKNML